jgi:hypothetical protein
MATLEKFRQFHYDATVKVSENTRTLALSAIAIIWLFKSGDSSHYVMPADLAKPLALVLGAMALDFFQHVYRSVVWHIEFFRLEKKLHAKEINEDDELYVSGWLNFPAYVFFYLKVLLLVFAYVGLLGHALRAISWK